MIKNLQAYLNEHQALLDLSGRLRANLQNGHFDHYQLSIQLRTLKAGLLLHVIAEDQDFYPRFTHCGNREVERITRALLEKTHGIERHFDGIEHHWATHRSFHNYPGLLSDIAAILSLLEHRIGEENRIIALARQAGLEALLDP